MNSLQQTLGQDASALIKGFAWPMLWQSALLIAVLFGLDLLLSRKVRPTIRYALWTVVLIKLVLPPSLALPTGPTWWVRSGHEKRMGPQPTTAVLTYGRSNSSPD